MNNSVAELRTPQQAFTESVVPEIEVLYRVALCMTEQPADAQDLVQDTLLRAYRSIETFDGRHPRAWLLTILRNTEHNRHRRQRPQLLNDPDDPAALATLDPDQSPEDLLTNGLFDTEVHHAFLALPEKYRHALALVDIEGLSYADAAVKLDVPVGTVMSRLHRARAQIRRHLTTEGTTIPRRRP